MMMMEDSVAFYTSCSLGLDFAIAAFLVLFDILLNSSEGLQKLFFISGP
jgi:hypothetical protein